MDQSFPPTALPARRYVRTRQSLIGLVTVGAFFFGSLGTTQAATPKTITIAAAQNGTLITVNPGTRIDVRLANNWTFSTQGSRAVVKLLTWSTVTGSSGAMHACVPGQTCTSSLAQFYALKPGLMRLIAREASCPAGAACSASQMFWTVVIRVR